jgi:hypothetical protein
MRYELRDVNYRARIATVNLELIAQKQSQRKEGSDENEKEFVYGVFPCFSFLYKPI